MQYKTIVYVILFQVSVLTGCITDSEKQQPIELGSELKPLSYQLRADEMQSFPYPLPVRHQAEIILAGNEENPPIGKVISWDLDGNGVSEVLEFKDKSSHTRFYDFNGDGKIDLIK